MKKKPNKTLIIVTFIVLVMFLYGCKEQTEAQTTSNIDFLIEKCSDNPTSKIYDCGNFYCLDTTSGKCQDVRSECINAPIVYDCSKDLQEICETPSYKCSGNGDVEECRITYWKPFGKCSDNGFEDNCIASSGTGLIFICSEEKQESWCLTESKTICIKRTQCQSGETSFDNSGDCSDAMEDPDCNDNNPCTTDKWVIDSCVNEQIECPSGTVCSEGKCEDEGCNLDSDCTSSCLGKTSTCSDGECIESGECLECTEDQECDDNNEETKDKCIENKCSNEEITNPFLEFLKTYGVIIGIGLALIIGLISYLLLSKKKK